MKWSVCIWFAVSCFLVTACAPVEPRSSGKDANYHLLMGSSYLEDGNPTMALQEFLMAEKLDVDSIEVQERLAQTYMIKGAYEHAERHYLKALELSDGEPRYQNNLGALYLSMERYQDAADAFRSAAENLLFANAEVAWTGLGVATLKLGDPSAAETYFKRALKESATYYQPYYQLGILYFSQDRSQEAAAVLEKAVKLRPGLADGHYRLGLAYTKTKQVEKARAAFREVLRLAPESEQAQHATNYLNILQ